MKWDPPLTQIQTGYYAPQMAYGMMPGRHTPPTSIQIPPAYQQQSKGGKWNNNQKNRRGQRLRPNNYKGGRRGSGYIGDHHNCSNTKKAYSNALNHHMNLLDSFFCGYDLDHDEYSCPTSCQKQIHLPNVKQDDAHMYEGACMHAQHKTLPNVTGAGRGWMMKKKMEKGRFLLDKQAA